MILAVDTAGPVVGVAGRADGRTVTRTLRIARGAETVLVPWMHEIARELGRGFADLRGIGVTDGPGAFTGLRVGLATAAGLAIARGVPVWSTDALTPRAAGRADVVMLDARKSRVFTGRFADGALVGEPVDVAPELAIAGLPPGFRAAGEGAVIYRAAVEAAGGIVVDDAEDPGVGVLVELAEAAIAAGQGFDPERLAPRYLRDADATPPARGAGRA